MAFNCSNQENSLPLHSFTLYNILRVRKLEHTKKYESKISETPSFFLKNLEFLNRIKNLVIPLRHKILPLYKSLRYMNVTQVTDFAEMLPRKKIQNMKNRFFSYKYNYNFII